MLILTLENVLIDLYSIVGVGQNLLLCTPSQCIISETVRI